MYKKWLKITAGSLFSLAVALLTIAGSQDHIDKLWRLSDSVYSLITFIGVVLICISVPLAGVLWIILPSGEALIKKRDSHFAVDFAKENELDELYRFCKVVLGDHVAPLERFRDWYHKNPRVYNVVYHQTRGLLTRQNKIVGFFSVFPVTREAERLLSENRLRGTEFHPGHIVSKGHKAAALYIGAIGAQGWRAKQHTLGMLIGQVASLADRRTPLVYTRPITRDGERLAMQYGFHPVLKQKSVTGEMIFFRDFSKGLLS